MSYTEPSFRARTTSTAPHLCIPRSGLCGVLLLREPLVLLRQRGERALRRIACILGRRSRHLCLHRKHGRVQHDCVGSEANSLPFRPMCQEVMQQASSGGGLRQRGCCRQQHIMEVCVSSGCRQQQQQQLQAQRSAACPGTSSWRQLLAASRWEQRGLTLNPETLKPKRNVPAGP